MDIDKSNRIYMALETHEDMYAKEASLRLRMIFTEFQRRLIEGNFNYSDAQYDKLMKDCQRRKEIIVNFLEKVLEAKVTITKIYSEKLFIKVVKNNLIIDDLIEKLEDWGIKEVSKISMIPLTKDNANTVTLRIQ